jgi:hypothetical protein
MIIKRQKHGLRATAIFNMSKCRILVNEVMWKSFSAFFLIRGIWRKNIDVSLLFR